MDNILAICRAYTMSKKDFVVVGSTAMYLHGKYYGLPKDIDIVVLDLSGIYGDIYSFTTDSKHSGTGKRACVIEDGIAKIDIFVENNLPDYEIIDGIRVSTVDSIHLYYKNLLTKVAELWHEGIIDKIKVLEYGK